MRTFPRLFYSHDAALSAAPLQQTERIKIIDAVRGIALLGILMMNIPYFGMPYQEVFDLRLRNEFSGVNYYTWWTVNGLFEGTMRALFSMLFGAGCILIIEKLERKQIGLKAADIYYRRLIWLILFGMFNAFILNWPGDILFNYGLCGLFIFPFRNMKPKGLLIMSIVILVISTVLSSVPMYAAKDTRQKGEAAIAAEKKGKLSEKQEGEKAAWEEMQKTRSVEELRKGAAEMKSKMQGDYITVMGTLAPFNVKFESLKMYKAFFWDAIAFMFFGMYLFRRGVLTGKQSNKFYVVMMLVGYAVGLSLNYFSLRTLLNINYDFTQLPDKMFISPYQVRRLFLALGHLSLIMLVFKLKILPFMLSGMAKVGQMAFSNYLMQSIICTLLFYGYGFGWYGEFERYKLYIIMLAIWMFQVAFSNLWLQYFRFGPFEWVWRSLTYWKSQPMRRKRSVEDEIEGEPAPVITNNY